MVSNSRGLLPVEDIARSILEESMHVPPVLSTARLQSVELPAGVRHQETTVIAESREAWDALTVADGWTERRWMEGDIPRARKVAFIRGHRITVLPHRWPLNRVDCPHCFHGTWSGPNGAAWRCGQCGGRGWVAA